MQTIRFVHVADLHLDAAFAGITRKAPAELVRTLRESTFVALDRLTVLCERERPDFLVIAGDAYNLEDRSLRAQLALRDACARLARVGVPVFIAHGNHDPLSSRLHGVRWPDNVTVFGEEPSSWPVFPDGSVAEAGELPLAVVHGVSHGTAREGRNLALRFHRTDAPCLQVGVLHCTVDGSRDKGRYAPCSSGDLAASGLDYWALGHAHERREIGARPLAVYPGCAQGLHINEEGEKGCVLVTAEPEAGGGYALSTVFHALGPVIWRILDVDLSTSAPDAGPDWLEDCLRGALRALVGEQRPGCEALVVRLRLRGRTGFDAALRRESFRADLLERLRAWETDVRDIEGIESGPRVWVKDIETFTRPLADRGRLLEREDLLGEIARLAEACRQSPAQMNSLGQAALTPLFDHPRARKVLAPLSDEEIARLLDDAESLCADLLESE